MEKSASSKFNHTKQNRLMEKVNLIEISHERYKARLRICTMQHASDWLTAIPKKISLYILRKKNSNAALGTDWDFRFFLLAIIFL